VSESEIWVVDDDRSIRWVLEKALHREGVAVRAFDSGEAALRCLQNSTPAVVISDVRMPDVDGFTVLSTIREMYPQVPVIIMTAFSDLESTVSAYQGGAFDYLAKPFDVDEAVALVHRALDAAARAAEAVTPTGPETLLAEREIVGSAPAMQEVFKAIGRLSRSHMTVLITGESGTGKELVARALHRHSPRAESQFVALNTAAIPAELLESELFGHERGAFTGAQARRVGRFEQADGGTLFLDEIGDMPRDLQTRLLRVLADGEFYRVGGHVPVKVDVRIIAATHQELDSRVRSGAFREDLFHRLNVIRVHSPALRDRREDVPELLHFFLSQAARELVVEEKSVRPEVLVFLSGLDWPGNVRQLENTCRWLTVMASGKEIHLDDLPAELRSEPGRRSGATAWERGLQRWAESVLAHGETGILETALPRFEKTLIDVALRCSEGRRQDAAKLLGWGRNTLTRKIREHRLDD